MANCLCADTEALDHISVFVSVRYVLRSVGQPVGPESAMRQIPCQYSKLLRLVRTHGKECVPLRTARGESPFTDDAHRKAFITACHSGFEKAQNQVIELLCALSAGSTPDHLYQEILLRKISDAIAFTMLLSKSHVMRRLPLHDAPPAFQPDLLRIALKEANSLNSESRMTFALVADASTFVHLGDILRIDHRKQDALLSIVELKSGRVNQELSRVLEDLPPDDHSVELVMNDEAIPTSKRKQAVRMLRQRVRLAQTRKLLETDRGIDIKTKKPMYLSARELEEEHFDTFLGELLTTASDSEVAAGTLNECIHIGVACNDREETAWTLALEAAKFAAYSAYNRDPGTLREVRKEIAPLVPEDQRYICVDLVRSNLNCVPCRPMTLWSVDPEHLLEVLAQKLKVAVLFDIASFIWLSRSLGVATQFSSRKRAAEIEKVRGRRDVPTWGGRGVEFIVEGCPQFMLSGMMSRFFNDLYCPASFIKGFQNSAGPEFVRPE